MVFWYLTNAMTDGDSWQANGGDTAPPPDNAAGVGAAACQPPHETTLLLPPNTSGSQSRPESHSPAQAENDDLPRLLPGESLAGRFTILRFIARGGMGSVYGASDIMLRTPVALKVIRGRIATDADAMERFRREGLLARRVGHPNVCRVYELYEATTANGVPIHFLTMELLEGESLAQLLARRGRLSTAEALPLVRQMCEGLEAAHAEGVVHRDFKSSNVMLVPKTVTGGEQTTESTRVVITDFGVARAVLQLADEADEERLTGRAGILGTPAYMAPEQVTGGEISPATDVYALGVVIYEMVTGTLPFSGNTPIAVAVRHIEEAPPKPELAAPGLPPRWSRTILRSLDRDPRRRFQRAREVAAALSGSPPGSPRWLLLAALVGIVVVTGGGGLLTLRRHGASMAPQANVAVAPPSIAVLPFVDMSPEHDQEYLSDGVAEEIINALTQVPGLNVVARSSSFSFKGKNEDVRAIGQKLNVAQVLEGSVRTAGNKLRVTAQLANTADGFELWSKTFDRELTDIFSVEDEIARAVTTALRVRVLSDSRHSVTQRRETVSEAYSAYLRGLQLLHAGGAEERLRAMEELRKAVALDPDYAPAHAALAKLSPDSPRALQEAERAVALDPKLADGYVARGIIKMYAIWDLTAAKRDLEQALALAPGDADALVKYCDLLRILGRPPAERLPYARLAVDLEPLSAEAHYALGYLYQTVGKRAEANALLEKAVTLAPKHFSANFIVGDLLKSDPAKALAAAQGAPDGWARLWGSALAQHSLGNDAASRRALKQLVTDFGDQCAVQIAEVYAWRGEREKAVAWLERAYAVRDPGLIYLKIDGFLRPLRDDPRYAALLVKLNFPAE